MFLPVPASQVSNKGGGRQSRAQFLYRLRVQQDRKLSALARLHSRRKTFPAPRPRRPAAEV